MQIVSSKNGIFPLQSNSLSEYINMVGLFQCGSSLPPYNYIFMRWFLRFNIFSSSKKIFVWKESGSSGNGVIVFVCNFNMIAFPRIIFRHFLQLACNVHVIVI